MNSAGIKKSLAYRRCELVVQIAVDIGNNPTICNEDMLFLVCRYIGADRLTLQKYFGYSKIMGKRGQQYGSRKQGLFEIFGLARRLKSGKGWLLNVDALPKRKDRKLYEFNG
jgi:hypothetical protein